MARTGPIVIIEDDIDDQQLVQEALAQIGAGNEIIFFNKAQPAFDFLLKTEKQPFMIITDMNLPGMNGLEFQKKVHDNEYLRKKSIPFIFFSTTDNPYTVNEAYQRVVQGYFHKPSQFADLKEILEYIIGYWKRCLHPNSQR